MYLVINFFTNICFARVQIPERVLALIALTAKDIGLAGAFAIVKVTLGAEGAVDVALARVAFDVCESVAPVA